MFSEIEQEEIINRFLDNIYVNDMLKIMKTNITTCPDKLEDQKVELSKLKLPNALINNICKFNCEECQECKYLREMPQTVKREGKSKAIDGLTFMFVKCHFFPDKEELRKEFNFSYKRIDCLRQIYKKINNNDLDMVRGIIELERVNEKKNHC